MKNIILTIASIFTMSSMATVCPDLKGQYHCMYPDQSYSLFVIDQKNITEEDYPIVQYSFDIRSLNLPPDIIWASKYGERDDWGWTSYCKDKTLLFISNMGQSESILYLDRNDVLVRKNNGRITQRCPRKKE